MADHFICRIVLSKLRTFFSRPYPHIRNRWVILVLVPLFISLFMVVFQPFGLQLLEHEKKNLLLVGYGMVTFIVMGFDMYILPLILPGLFRESRWTILSEVLFQVWLVLSIAAGNYLYSTAFHIVGWHGLYGFLLFIVFTFAVALIPIMAVIVISHNVMLRKHLEGAGEISRLISGGKESVGSSEKIRLHAQNRKQSVETTAFQLLCLESSGNYVQCWVLEEGKILEHSLRNTMKNVEKELEGAGGLIRCHRAYIVNLRHVKEVRGNSQGYRLHMKYLDKEIPVSRNYTKAFNEAFRSRK